MSTTSQAGQTRSPLGISMVFYTSALALLVLIMTKLLREMLPTGFAVQVGHNSEAICMCVLIGATVQFGVPYARRTGRVPQVMGTLGLIFVTIGAVLSSLRGDIDSAIATLTEAFVAAGFVAFYIAVPRRVRIWVPAVGAAALLVLAIGGAEIVTLQAESIVAVILIMVLLDVVSPQLLDPAAEPRPRLWWAWVIGLVVVPLIIAWLHAMHLDGWVGEAIRYMRRPTEAFIAVWALTLYFALIGKVSGSDADDASELTDSTQASALSTSR